MATLVGGFDHLSTATADLDAALAFYKSIFDLDPLPGFPLQLPDGRRIAVLPVGAGPVFQLIESDSLTLPPVVDPPTAFFYGTSRFDHASFAATDEAAFEELRRRLVDAKASEGKILEAAGQRFFAFRDPDGWLAEVVYTPR
jgi:catechol 2,3-dioxygenase-like lactoylglutathione lyase family enzyme